MGKREFAAEAAYRRIAGMDVSDETNKEAGSVAPNNQSAEEAKAQQPQQVVVSPIEVQKPKTPDGRRRGKKRDAELPRYLHKSYYIRPEHHKALKYRVLVDDDLDLSGHVRAALDVYLKCELQKIKESNI